MKPNESVGDTITACRHARALKWLTQQSVETQLNVAMLYAGHIKCPLCEIDFQPEIMDHDELSWLYSTFQSQIDRIDYPF